MVDKAYSGVGCLFFRNTEKVLSSTMKKWTFIENVKWIDQKQQHKAYTCTTNNMPIGDVIKYQT